MNRRIVQFTGPRQVECLTGAVPRPAHNQVLAKTELTAISAGTEMLLFRGQIPENADLEADAVSSGLKYPTPYGYCAVATVIEAGASVDASWLGRRVFGFQPHVSHFVAEPSSLLEIPPGLGADEAVFLPGAETAVNLVQDAAPILGECVLVLGQGVLGLLVAALLRDFPLESLVTADGIAARRKASEAIGVDAALDPADSEFDAKARSFAAAAHGAYDLTIELTGNPAAVDRAIELTAFTGRVVVGSWFGTKAAPLHLGGSFHRSRIRLLASQVSTIAPELSGRWDKSRRYAAAWTGIQRIRPSRWISHRFPIERAAEAYRLLDETPDAAIQVVFEYS